MQNNIRKTFENTFAAAAFAEAGEHETAMKFAGIRAAATTVIDRIRQLFDVHMTATCFAEAGCHDTAQEMIAATERRDREETRPTLNDFLESVGLQNAPVRFGLATV